MRKIEGWKGSWNSENRVSIFDLTVHWLLTRSTRYLTLLIDKRFSVHVVSHTDDRRIEYKRAENHSSVSQDLENLNVRNYIQRPTKVFGRL